MLKTITLAALITTAGVVLPTAAFAASAEAKSAVNVRDEGSLDSEVLYVLAAGDAVDVAGCEGGWCFVSQPGEEPGWVAESFLSFGGSDDEDEDEIVVADDDESDDEEGDEDEGDAGDDEEGEGEGDDDGDDLDVAELEISDEDYESLIEDDF